VFSSAGSSGAGSSAGARTEEEDDDDSDDDGGRGGSGGGGGGGGGGGNDGVVYSIAMMRSATFQTKLAAPELTPEQEARLGLLAKREYLHVEVRQCPIRTAVGFRE